MTKAELIKMMGDEDKADWMIEQILRSIKPGFVMSILKLKKSEADGVYASKKQSGYYAEGEEALKQIPDGFSLFGDENNPEWQENKKKYDLWEERRREEQGDRMWMNFTHNVYTHAMWNKPEEV